MSVITFLQDAGEKLFHPPSVPAQPRRAASAGSADLATLNHDAAAALQKYLQTKHFEVEGLDVRYDGATRTVTVSGLAADQATKEKLVLCCGNVDAVARVDDKLTVAIPSQPPSTYREVTPGDTLSKIAKEAYGDAKQYPRIFDANRPMLSDPDEIYPGQKLRIPPV